MRADREGRCGVHVHDVCKGNFLTRNGELVSPNAGKESKAETSYGAKSESNVLVRRDRARQYRKIDDTRRLFRVGCNLHTKTGSTFSQNLKATSSNTTTTAATQPHPHPQDAWERNAAGKTVKEGDKLRRCDSKDAGSSTSGSNTSQSLPAAWAGCEDGLRDPHSLEANRKREADGGHTGKRNVMKKEGPKFKFGKEVRGDTRANGEVVKKRLGMHAHTAKPTKLVPVSGLYPGRISPNVRLVAHFANKYYRADFFDFVNNVVTVVLVLESFEKTEGPSS